MTDITQMDGFIVASDSGLVNTGESFNPCSTCGDHVNAAILETSPDCPHGWQDITNLADIKSDFARIGIAVGGIQDAR